MYGRSCEVAHGHQCTGSAIAQQVVEPVPQSHGRFTGERFAQPKPKCVYLLAVIYASGVAILAIIDYAPYAISSEGSRLTYYLVAQTGKTTYLRSRLKVLLIAALLVGLTISLVMSWWIGLSIFELAQAVVMVSLIVTAYTAFSVWGSAWDEDLNLISEGMMPVITQEELPFTPKRLQLLGLRFRLIGVMFLLVWKLPLSLLVPTLMLLDAIVLILGWHFSNAQIRGLIVRG